MTMHTLPLSCLTLSKLNVRQTERDADIAALAEDIAACGLKQNLVVVPAHFSTAETTENFGDKFEVIAGGRRLQALQLLVGDGRIEFDYRVPVLVEAREEARQTSLSENLHRVAMNPADEFEAFALIVDYARREQGETDPIGYCAKRFGVTKAHVEGRLRLATLCPELLEALRSGAITLDTAKAYAGTTDHDLQAKVFKGRNKDDWRRNDAKGIRQELRGARIPATDNRVQFVGLDAYRAAGGRTETELFMGADGTEQLLDVALLQQLVTARAEEMLPAQAKADGYKSGLFMVGWVLDSIPEGFRRVWDSAETITKAEKKKSIGVYRLGAEAKLEFQHRLAPVPTEEQAEEQQTSRTHDWKAQREAERREEQIRARAAQLAIAPECTAIGTDRIVWPQWLDDYIVEDEDSEHALITLSIRTPKALIDQHREEAARQIDAEAEVEATAEIEQSTEEAA